MKKDTESKAHIQLQRIAQNQEKKISRNTLPRAAEKFSDEDWTRLRKTVRDKLEKEALPNEFE